MADELRHVPVASLRPNSWNRNRLSPQMRAALAANLERVGFAQTILVRPVDDSFEIIDGEHRWREAVERGDETVPVIVKELDDVEARKQTLAINKIHGSVDAADMAIAVREIAELGGSLDDLTGHVGFTQGELDAILAGGSDDLGLGGDGAGADDQSSAVQEGWYVLVTCPDESTQLGLLERLEGEGLEVRAVVG